MRVLGAMIVSLALLSRAHADDAVNVTSGGFLIPALQLSASSDDQGKLKASIPVLLPSDSDLRIIAAARLQVSSSKGVSTLFSTSNGESLPWEGGMTLLIVDPPPMDMAIEAQAGQAKVRAYDLCARQCTDPAKCEFKATTDDEKRRFSKAKLCPAGHDQYLHDEAEFSTLRSIPENRYSVGGAAGKQQFKYLTGPFGPGNKLATDSTSETSLRIAALYTHAWALEHKHAGVVEVRGLYSLLYNAASGTGHWCQPQGMVGSDPNSTVQQCKDLALGPPTRARSFTVAADLGVADSFAQTWRASVGGFVTTGFEKTPDALGFEVPIYLNFTPGSAVTDYLGSYKGILRVTPRLSWSKDASNHWPTMVTLTVEALGQDSIFAEALDY